MDSQSLASLDTLVILSVWACRLVAVAIGVLLFRFVSLRSSL